MGRSVIVGAGTIGTALARRLAGEGDKVVLVSRRGTAPAAEGVHGVAMDATNAELLAELAHGADAVFNCANPPYHRWSRDWPPLAASLLNAARDSGAVLVTLSNLYGYGPLPHAMSESDPLAASSVKGRVRAAMWLDAKAAHDAGAIRATEVRASDYVGPGVTSQGWLGERTVPKVLDGGTVFLLGDLDAPHSWSYVGDVVTALVTVARDERAWGRAWHAPTPAPQSARAMVAGLAAAAGLDVPAIHRLPWSVAGAVGLVTPMVRELREIAYQFNAPFVVDSTAFTSTFGVCPTSSDEALAETIAWWRQRRGFPLPSFVTASARH
jgi:nucleoside-diphosphate-sugar epimerase